MYCESQAGRAICKQERAAASCDASCQKKFKNYSSFIQRFVRFDTYDGLMPVTISTIHNVGLEGRMIQVEIDISAGLPSCTIVGLADTAVLEARERIRSAIKNSGYVFPPTRKTISLAPADVKKHGPAFDLAMAVGLLAASKQLSLGNFQGVLLGELSLSGEVRGVPGIIPLLLSAKKHGVTQIIIPEENAREASIIEGLDIRVVSTLCETVNGLSGKEPLRVISRESQLAGVSSSGTPTQDLSDPFAGIVGQEKAKQAIAIAAAGHHHILLSGPPGVGKSLLAHAISQLLPPLSSDEFLEVASLHSLRGINLLDTLSQPTARTSTLHHQPRPVREIHHTSSLAAIIGGTSELLPGEISLAHRGVLVLDEISEFPHDRIESLRQPIENGTITLTRASGSVTYPCKFLMLATTNPCPCGFLGDPKIPCRCTQGAIRIYNRRISGPIHDRIDLKVTMEPINKKEVVYGSRTFPEISSTDSILSQIALARARQRARYTNTPFTTNADLTAETIFQYCHLDALAKKALTAAATKLNLSARAIHRTIKIARTIADMEIPQRSEGMLPAPVPAPDIIHISHITQALQYR